MRKTYRREGFRPIVLPDPLILRCRNTLLKCDKFQSEEQLRTVFTRQGMHKFRYGIPEARNVAERVEKSLHFFLEKGVQDGQFVFLRFLRTLQSLEDTEEELYTELENCCIDIEYEVSVHKIMQRFDDISSEQLNAVRDIAHHFFMCMSMSNKDQRAMVLARCSTVPATSFHHEGSDFDDVLYIVTQTYLSSSHSTYPNSLEKLAEALYQFERDSLQWIRLDRLLCEKFGRVISPIRLKQLRSLITQITWPPQIVKRAYSFCLPTGWIRSNIYNEHVITMFDLILKDLAKIPFQSNNSFPILEFVCYLAHYAEQQQGSLIAQPLMEWIDARAEEVGLQQAELLALHQQALNGYYNTTAYLLVTLEEEDQNLFSFNAWLLDSGCSAHTTDIQHTYAQTSYNEIALFLDELLAQYSEQSDDEEKPLIVEIFLPNNLLGLNVDDWLVDVGMMKVKLGAAHKVVVRSFDRARKKKMHASWKHKWNILQGILNGQYASVEDEEVITMCNEEQCGEPDRFFITLHNSHTVCLALNFAPFNGVSHRSHVFEPALSAGIPVALWFREKTNDVEKTHEWLRSLLSRQKLAKLPQLVYEQRCEAGLSDDEHHPGNHMTLLWDDPHRLPPSVIAPFAMPSARR